MYNEIVHWVNFLYTLDLSETYQHIRIDKTCDDVQNQLPSGLHYIVHFIFILTYMVRTK